MSEILLKNVALWPGYGPSVQPDMSILLSKGKVSRIAPSSVIEEPEGARVVDGAGATAIPGLSDIHVHLTTNSDMRQVVDNATASRPLRRVSPRCASWGIAIAATWSCRP